MRTFRQSLAQLFGIETGTRPQYVRILRPRMLLNVLLYIFWRRFYPLKAFYQPINLMVEISTVCNFRCPDCERELYKNELSGLPKENVTLENLKKIGGILPYVYSVYFVGGLGEPFLNPEFWQIHRFFKKFGVKTGYFSNASLITEDIIEKTFKERVDNITISIDTTIKEKYEEIKKGADFNTIKAVIERFAFYKKKYRHRDFRIGLNYIFRSDNAEDILPYLDFAHQLGVDFVHCTSLITHLEQRREKSFFEVDQAFKKKIFFEAEKKAKKLGIGLRLPALDIDPNQKCECLWKHLSIFYNGDVCACPYFRTPRNFYYHVKNGRLVYEKQQVCDNIVGNYLETDIRKIWNSSRMQALRRSETNKNSLTSPCDLCYYKYRFH